MTFLRSFKQFAVQAFELVDHAVVAETGQAVLPAGPALSTVHGIVQEHGGRLEIETEQGKGSTFRVIAPCLELEAVPEIPTGASGVPGGAGELILLASGDPQQCGLISSTLQRHGYEVIKAADEESLGEAYRRHGDRVRLLVIDIDWLGHTKLECLPEMGQDRSGAAAILITGEAGSSEGGSWPRNTVLLQKPFQMSDLARLVSELLQNHGGPKESR